jgi:hypothetical protein
MIRHLPELLFMASCGLGATTLIFAALWVRARERAVRAEGMMAGMRSGMAPQLGLEPAIDAIATEVERIGEGQRFLTKIIADRGNTALPSRKDYGSNTPH